MVAGYIEDRAERARRRGGEKPPETARPAAGRPETTLDSAAKALTPKEAGGGALAAKLSEIRRLAANRKFAEAEALARQTLESASDVGGEATKELEEIARLAARAAVLRKFLSSLPAPQKLQEYSEVLLASGVTVKARAIKKEGDRYLLELPSGATWKPRAEEVIEVRSVDTQAYLASEKAKIEQKLQTLSHPVDLYLEGVLRYHALGFEEEAYRVLERILAGPPGQALEVLLLFMPDADEELRSEFQVAIGMEKPRIPRARLASSPPDRPRGSEVASANEATKSFPAGDTGELVRAVQLITQAQVLYKGAALKEGKEDDLTKARELLDQAREILEGQPEDETVRKLRRQVGQLMSDIARASTF